MKLPFAFREARESDMNFVRDSWLRCARTIPPWPRIGNDAFFDEVHGYKAHVNRTIGKATILLAVDTTDDDHIFGYIVYEPNTIHFIYVKGGDKESSMRSMRRKVGVGVGTELVKMALPNFGKVETIATERYRYLDQWKDWCAKYRIVFKNPHIKELHDE